MAAPTIPPSSKDHCAHRTILMLKRQHENKDMHGIGVAVKSLAMRP
jgi:hypothetical protein